jgi:hypothetical protein
MNESQTGSSPNAYQANTLSKSLRKGVQDSHSWVEPSCEPFVISLGLMESLNLLINEGKNVAGRVAVLELGEKWVQEEILPRALSVGLQGIVEN